MFEQRLTHDELGVAIRKISHSGKAQLRYVKCVVLRPPSSSDFGNDMDGMMMMGGGGGVRVDGSSIGGGGVGGGSGSDIGIGVGSGAVVAKSIPGIGTYLEKKNGEAAAASSSARQRSQSGCDVSVSSSVSSRFMERIKSVVGRNSIGNTTSNNNKNTTSSSIHGGGEDEDEDDDNNSLLLHDTVATTSRPPPPSGGIGGVGGSGSSSTSHHHHHPPNKSLRALTWGKKNAITIPLDKFTCVRKGKTTERTVRNGASASRLLSIVVGSSCNTNDVDGTGGTTSSLTYQQQQQQQQQQESLDIEAPTRLDRDKFASAFARFLGVPLIEEDEHDDERMGRSGVGGGEFSFRARSSE